MKSTIVFALISSLFAPLATSGQSTIDYLKIRGKVVSIEESGYEAEKEPRENAYVFVHYKVLKVCKGVYDGEEIKVAHGIASLKRLKVDDQIELKIKPTSEFREVAELLREVGISRREESIADFIFVKFDSCTQLNK
jgi:hypothetical protein